MTVRRDLPGNSSMRNSEPSPSALAVLADGQGEIHAVPRAYVSLVEGVVGQVGQADERLGRK